MLVIAGLFFYGYWSIPFLALLLTTSLIDYFFAQLIYKTKAASKKKIFFLIPIISNLSVLFFFKYFNFFHHEFCVAFHISDNNLALKIILPLGISFYTFQAMAYIIDVYKEKVIPEKNSVTYLSFIIFFPQLMAGPIEKPSNMLSQFNKRRYFNYNSAVQGLELLLLGFVKKVALADNLALIADDGFNNINNTFGLQMWVAVIAFSFQIYFDFSGYSNMAVGLAKLLGIDLMRNFNNPYFSININDFWKRWHISLSSWFKQYVYIPLGGNKNGVYREYVNLLITFIVSGLWHGANFTFIIWGLYHGLLSLLNKLFFYKITIHKTILYAFTFLLVMIGWVFFRAQTVNEALTVFKHLLLLNTSGTVCFFTIPKTLLLITSIGFVFFIEYAQENLKLFNQNKHITKPIKLLAYFIGLIVILLLGVYQNNPSFIYFNF